jgi:hypothetical protein
VLGREPLAQGLPHLLLRIVASQECAGQAVGQQGREAADSLPLPEQVFPLQNVQKQLLMVTAKKTRGSGHRSVDQFRQHSCRIGASIDVVAEIDLDCLGCAGCARVGVDPAMDLLQEVEAAVDVADGIDRPAVGCWRVCPGAPGPSVRLTPVDH